MPVETHHVGAAVHLVASKTCSCHQRHCLMHWLSQTSSFSSASLQRSHREWESASVGMPFPLNMLDGLPLPPGMGMGMMLGQAIPMGMGPRGPRMPGPLGGPPPPRPPARGLSTNSDSQVRLCLHPIDFRARVAVQVASLPTAAMFHTMLLLCACVRVNLQGPIAKMLSQVMLD